MISSLIFHAFIRRLDKITPYISNNIMCIQMNFLHFINFYTGYVDKVQN